MELINLGSIVDTLKINANFSNLAYEKLAENQDSELERQLLKFNSKIDDLIKEKNKAQEIKSHDAQNRFVVITLHKNEYRVMASASASYGVILQNGDISIFLRKFSKNVKNPVLKVEFRAEYLARYGYVKAVETVQRIIEAEFIEKPVYKIKEIHLATDIQGYEFTPLDFYRIKTLSRTRTVFSEDEKNSYFTNQRFTGMTFGKGDLMLRIYNKTAEIHKNKKKGFIEVLKWQHNENFNPDMNVWRIEGQIRRDKLKELALVDINLDSLDSVLNNIPSIWKLFIDRFVHKDLKDTQIHEQIQGYKRLKNGGIKILLPDTFRMRFKNADTSQVWSLINTFNGHQGYELDKFEDIKKPEVEYVENSYKALISTFTKLKRGNFCTSDLVELIHNANDKFFNKKGFSILDNARINALDYLSTAKLYYKKNGFVFDGFDEFEKDMYKNLTAIIKPIEEIQERLEIQRIGF
jgi:hypothetical protein